MKSRLYFKSILSALLFIGILISGSQADAMTLPLNDLSHGRIVNNQFSNLGVLISGETFDSNALDEAIIFDSRVTSTEDPDLEDPWSGGNIASGEVLGNLLILPESGRTVVSDQDGGIVANPNDEGRRPAGVIRFDFTDYSINSFGFDLVDVEEAEKNGGFFAAFFDNYNNMLKEVKFAEFENSVSPFYVPGLTFGDNSANRIAGITAEVLGIKPFNRVEIGLGGSGGITGINFTPVPEPATLLLLGTGLVGLAGFKRKTKKR